MKFVFDKKSIIILGLIVIVTLFCVVVLSNIKPAKNLTFNVKSQSLSFTLKNFDRKSHYIQLLSSAILANKITIKNFSTFEIFMESINLNGENDWKKNKGNSKFKPKNKYSTITFSTNSNNLSLVDLFSTNNCNLSITHNEGILSINGYYGDWKEQNDSNLMSVISLGDTVSFKIEQCELINNSDWLQKILKDSHTFEFEGNTLEYAQNIEIKSSEGQFSIDLELNKTSLNDSLELFRNVFISDLNFLKKTIGTNGEILHDSSIKSGFINILTQNEDYKKIKNGGNIKIKADQLFIKDSFIKKNNLATNITSNGTKSFKNEKIELIGNLFDWLISRPEIRIGYSIVVALLSLLGLVRKEEK